MGQILLILIVLFQTVPAFGQTPADGERLKNALNEKGDVSFARLTSEGKFRGCELNYKKLYRDYRAHQGELVAVYGTVNSHYFEGKTFNLTFKLRTALVNPMTGDLKRFQPAYATLGLGKSLDQFKNAEFKCEDDGICIGYGDNAKFELMALTIDKWQSPGPSITVTTSKGGTDATFKVRDIDPMPPQTKDDIRKALVDFQECLGEVMGSMISYIERMDKKK